MKFRVLVMYFFAQRRIIKSMLIISLAVIFIVFGLAVVRHNYLRSAPRRKPKVYVNGISSSFPKTQYLQSDMKEMFIKNYCGGKESLLPYDLDFIDRVFSKTLINTSHVNLPKEGLFKQMERETYTKYVKETMLAMACEAARSALQNAALLPKQITHIVFGTMTGTIHAPSLDISIMRELGLDKRVKRLNVESMGCLTGFRLTGLCQDIATENEENVILLIVCDVRSALGNQLTPFQALKPIDKSNVIISAMFRDSAGAAVFSQKPKKPSDIQVIEHRSFLVPDSFDKVLLQEFNDGKIHLYLDKLLPDSIFVYIPDFVNELLAEHSINISQCLFALHTGGPRIINGVQECLKLENEQLFGTWLAMKKYGNLSGSSNLVVLDHIMRFQKLQNEESDSDTSFPSDFSKYTHIIGLSFGPGIGVECVLFKI